MHVTTTDVRQRLGEILERVSGGEEVVVTRRSDPVAAIVPAPLDTGGGRRPLGLAAHVGALARLDGFGETIATAVSLRSVARDREPPGLG